MKYSSHLLEEAVNAFATLPGIGKKSALRLALYLLDQDPEKTDQFTEAIGQMRKGITRCKQCFNIADQDICGICRDKNRNGKVICVVESIRDIMAIEETSQFQGVYHVLGGIISPIDGVGPSDLTIEALVERVKKEQVEELIMAISPTIEGDTTIYYISKQVAELPVKVTTIARGVAFGGELQYTDGVTLGRSIVARIPYQIRISQQ